MQINQIFNDYISQKIRSFTPLRSVQDDKSSVLRFFAALVPFRVKSSVLRFFAALRSAQNDSLVSS